MSATSDGQSLEEDGLSFEVLNVAFQFLEDGSQNEDHSDYGEQNSEVPKTKGHDLTMSQLYCLTNQEDTIDITLNKNNDEYPMQTPYVSGKENQNLSTPDGLSEEFVINTNSRSEIKSNKVNNYASDQEKSLCTNETNEFEQENLMTVSQLHKIISTAKIPGVESKQGTSQENDVTVSQLYCLNQNQNKEEHCTANSLCDKLSCSEHDADVKEDEQICGDLEERFDQLENVRPLHKEDGGKIAGQCELFTSEKVSKENSNSEEDQIHQVGAVSADLEQNSEQGRCCIDISREQATVVNSTKRTLEAEAGTSVQEMASLASNETGQGLERDFSANPECDSKSAGNSGGFRTSDVNCDKIGNLDNRDNGKCIDQVANVGDKMFVENNGSGDRIDSNEEKLMNNYSKINMINKEETLALDLVPDGQGENTGILRNESDSCRNQLSVQYDSKRASNTCLDKEICNVVYKLDQEISSVLEKCEYLLQRPGDLADVRDPHGACDEVCTLSNTTSITEAGTSDKTTDKQEQCIIPNTNIKIESSQESTPIMGATISTEKLEKIRVRSKLQERGHDDIYIGPNYEGVDLKKTSDEYKGQQHQEESTTASLKKGDGDYALSKNGGGEQSAPLKSTVSDNGNHVAIKGTILPNMKNSLFSERDTVGSIQGNYGQSHEISGAVSHEFNHLGKHGDGDSATASWVISGDEIHYTTAVAENPHQQETSLTCSEKIGKAQSDKILNEQQVQNKLSNETGGLVESNPISKDQRQKSTVPQGQGQKEGQSSTGNDRVIRKDILRSRKLRSPKMSPLLRDRRFRHARAGSADSDSGSDPESADSQRSEESDDDDEDAGKLPNKSWCLHIRQDFFTFVELRYMCFY